MRKAAGALSALLWTAAWITAVVWGIAGSAGILERVMLRTAPPAATGLPQAEYAGVCRMTADYLTGKAGEFQYRYVSEETGTEVECFRPHEAAHMADCRQLITLDGRVCVVCLLAAAGLTAWALRNRDGRADFARGALRGLAGLAAAAGVLLVWALADFDGLFVTFHRVAFTNDGWLLDPRTDLLIRLMPTEFFTALGVLGGAAALVMPALLCVVSLGLIRREGKRDGLRGELPEEGGGAEGEGIGPDPGAGDQL